MRCEIIAEIGQNHDGDMDRAFTLIREAASIGADVAKFQMYDAKALFPKEGNEWYEYNCQTEISREQCEALANECAHAGIEFMASVFDIERIAWLEDMGVKRHKVASRSIHDQELLEALCATGKPLLVSLGQWTQAEFPEVHASGGVHFLHCISKYPTPLEDVGLAEIDFSRYAGFSDHTLSLTAPMVAMARGARIIEKHFTLDRNMYGPDHAGSMTPDDLETLCRFRDELEICL